MVLKLDVVLKKILKERGLTLKELAQATHIKASTLSGWNNGVSPRDLTEVRTCARYLGVGLEKLLFDEDPSEIFLNDLLTENFFDGFLKVRIERVIPRKK